MPELMQVEVIARIEEALEEIRPGLWMDGGDVSVESYSDGLLMVRLEGACTHCGFADVTMEEVIRATVCQQVPEVLRVESVREPEPDDAALLPTTTTLDLRKDHLEVLATVAALEESFRYMAGPALTIDQQRYFAETYGALFDELDVHLHLEEEVLFTAVATSLPSDRGPIAVMLYEHGMMRQFERTIRDALATGVALGPLMQLSSEYFALLREHIHKEDHVLFPMCDQLTAASQAELLHTMREMRLTHDLRALVATSA